MKKTDGLFILFIVVVLVLLINPLTHHAFFGFTDRYVLLGGFIKFFLFATIGDVISHRIKRGNYRLPGLFKKAVLWGILGVFIVMIFTIFFTGTKTLQTQRILPFEGILFFTALFTSVLMNLFFAPTMMFLHRLGDQIIDDRLAGIKSFGVSLKNINYHAFLHMLFKTIPLFWIPAHTITFLLPQTYRAFYASLLGIMLGLLLNMFKKHA